MTRISLGELPFPPEPVEGRRQWQRLLREDYRSARAVIKQSTAIASPLWTGSGWGIVLKRHHVTWQRFMEAVRDCYPSRVDWVEGKISWKDALARLVDSLQQ